MVVHNEARLRQRRCACSNKSTVAGVACTRRHGTVDCPLHELGMRRHGRKRGCTRPPRYIALYRWYSTMQSALCMPRTCTCTCSGVAVKKRIQVVSYRAPRAGYTAGACLTFGDAHCLPRGYTVRTYQQIKLYDSFSKSAEYSEIQRCIHVTYSIGG